jgi:uncharacterized protein YndB with AHSA1/START domain
MHNKSEPPGSQQPPPPAYHDCGAAGELAEIARVLNAPVMHEFVAFAKAQTEIQEGSAPSPCTPNYCYLVAVREDARKKMWLELKSNPWLVAVQSWLQDHPSVWTSERLSIQYGLDRGDPVDGRGFVQAHLTTNRDGLSVRELLAMQSANVRLGSDRQEATGAQAPATGRSQLTALAPAASPVVTVPFYATLVPAAAAARFSPRTDPNVVAFTKYFESVRLESFDMSLSIAGGCQVSVAFGVGTGASVPKQQSGFLEMPMSALYSGNTDGLGVGDFSLPAGHSFGVECKAISVGNPDPVFTWRADAEGVQYQVTIRGTARLRLAGSGVAVPFSLPLYK